MPRKQASPEPVATHSSSSDEETIEVQVEKARKAPVRQSRAKGVPSLQQRGKEVQAKGTEARKQSGAASTRERELQRLAKKNDQLERLAKIEAAEKAEKDRADSLSRASHDKKKATLPDGQSGQQSEAGELNMRLAKLEELMTARAAESAAAPKRKRAPAKKQPPPESESDDEPPRQKAVKRSAKTELKRRAGAEEEHLHGRSNLLHNQHKGKAIELEQQERMRELAMNIMPGRYL